jgi:hypothetical protein
MRLKHYAYATPLILLPTTIPDYNFELITPESRVRAFRKSPWP